ncbi:MAG: GTPase HflX [Candidatus Omnitrophica bacterium]|nr:GTPase HflX [Candidatus Omnitrophota bacterium]
MSEKCCLVIPQIKGKRSWDSEDLIRELRLLTRTARGEVRDIFTVNIENITSNYYIGRGKLDEIARTCCEKGINAVIFNNNLTPAQQRNIEDVLGIKVIDRTQLILDIFAHRARTSEGKIQVELAQLNYLLPRLTGKGILLSRLGGGIGTSGPGETKLEVDRRRIRQRITNLKQEIKDVARRREVERKGRKQSKIPHIAVVGYTNAGKSTLVNSLSGSDIFVEDKLFATLDTTTRSVKLSNDRKALMTDTVGFIRDLPPYLIAAFRATMEEIVEADFIVHLLDISHPKAKEMETITRGFLGEIGAGEKKVLLVLNKIDRLNEGERRRALREYSDGAPVSAMTKEGLKELCLRLMHLVGDDRESIKAAIPQKEGRILWEIHEEGGILSKAYKDGKVIITARVSPPLMERLKSYKIK